MAASLPDELWRHILEIGVRMKTSGSDQILKYKDLCRLTITCRRLHRLSDEDSLWSHLLASDFAPLTSSLSAPPISSTCKSLYRIRFERERDKEKAAHRRAVLRKESQIAEHLRKIREIEGRLSGETEKLKATADEFANLHRIRQASVALNVWQPEVVRGRQKQVVAQCPVSVESRISAIDMELKLCKQQIAALRKSREDEKQRLHVAKQELESIKYHPLRDYDSTIGKAVGTIVPRKRLKKRTDA